ncbi:MAG: glutamate 5-kinase [Anaerolineae bacterium]|nr:glutamate 5-kinase [Anaerolineae bacterium]
MINQTTDSVQSTASVRRFGELQAHRRVVIKLGTSVLTGGTRRLSPPQMVDIARQCAELYHRGYELIVCTSGAVAAGRERLGFPELPATVASKQMLAAVGQSRLMLMWERFFEIYGIHVGQILLTHGDVESRHRFLNAQDTLHTLIENHIVPIINENDAVATEEIKIGDNDNLSALVAVLTSADLLILLTDQAGLFTADPRETPNAKLITEVDVIDDKLRALAGGSRSGLGVGGMITKIEAATVARRAGTHVIITDGKIPNVLVRVLQGENLGTHIPAIDTPPENRKRWVLAGAVNSGHIVVDAGARHALCHRGRSLLSAGIVAIEGEFDRGDTVSIIETNGLEFARGIARYPSQDMDRIKGHHSDAIPDILGYTYGVVAIHRNDLILL